MYPRSPAAIFAALALNWRRAAHLFAFALALVMVSLPGRALASDADVQTSWRLLDYIGVDYAGAVADGKVISSAEYGEMTEFAAQVETRLKALPAKPAKADLLRRSATLRSAIAAKSAPAVVAEQSHLLASALLAAYPVPLAPGTPPDLNRAAKLYAENCASCHGVNGDGRGRDAAKLDPPPIAFTDKERADQRSLFGLYQVISQGLDGTAMQSFEALPEADRWALAFYAGHFAYPDAAASEGERLWRERADIRSKYPNLAALVGTTPAALARDLGPKTLRCSRPFCADIRMPSPLVPTARLRLRANASPKA